MSLEIVHIMQGAREVGEKCTWWEVFLPLDGGGLGPIRESQLAIEKHFFLARCT
jgi:hypothetical protein